MATTMAMTKVKKNEDRVVDLEDAIDDLKAEFEKMMRQGKGDAEDKRRRRRQRRQRRRSSCRCRGRNCRRTELAPEEVNPVEAKDNTCK